MLLCFTVMLTHGYQNSKKQDFLIEAIQAVIVKQIGEFS
jgi:hypothetical protein